MDSASSQTAGVELDAALLPALRACQRGGAGGELRFVDAFFAFLRRNTQMLQSTQAVEQIQQTAMKHVEQAKKDAQAAKEKAKAAEAAKQEEAENKKKTEAQAAAAAAATAAVSLSSSSSSSSSSSPSAAAPSSSSSSTCLPDAAAASDAEDSLPDPIDNGGVTPLYSWTQTLAEVTVSIPLPAGTTTKQLKVVIESDALHAQLLVGAGTVFVSGAPDEAIDSSDATWTLASGRDGKLLELFLPKRNKMSWWQRVVKGGPGINSKKIVPENSKLDDLDSDTRATVEKMMFDNRQKQMGKPTSDEMQKQAALKRFMEMHPEMDFSQAKFS